MKLVIASKIYEHNIYKAAGEKVNKKPGNQGRLYLNDNKSVLTEYLLCDVSDHSYM
jgi:hypothetical protein